MIRSNEIDLAREQRLPERVLRRRIAKGRGALERGTNALEVVLGEREIMRTGLGRDRHTVIAGGVHLGETRRAADVDDVSAHPFAGASHADKQTLDRFDLRGRGSAVAPRQPIDTSFLADLARRPLDHLLALSMHTDERVEPRPHAGQCHGVLAHGDGRVVGPLVLGERLGAPVGPVTDGVGAHDRDADGDLDLPAGDRAAVAAVVREALLRPPLLRAARPGRAFRGVGAARAVRRPGAARVPHHALTRRGGRVARQPRYPGCP